MNQILAALLNAQPANAASSNQSATSSSSDASSAAQFKSQFDQAVQSLAKNPATQHIQGGGSYDQGLASSATTAGSTVQTAALADSLQKTLQKKIADLLAKGETVAEIVQQLAASLAASIAQQFGGDPNQIQNQLQAAFASALAPPTTTGPPQTSTDIASALAQRFRQIADVAAGVLGETGQSNRLFAGSNLDAATTAGVQPAPTTTTPTPSVADSMAADAQALLATLTASQGDGKTVATNGANTGTNGDTLLGRILARAQAAQAIAPGPQTQDKNAPAPSAQSSVLTAMALAQASIALGTPAAVTTSAPDPSATAVQRIIASDQSASSVPAELATTTSLTEPAPLNPAVTAFLKSFSDALTTTSNAVTDKPNAQNDTDPGALLQTSVSSSQAPTIGAFAPVQAAIRNDAASADSAKSSETTSSQTPADSSTVVDQLLHGVFMNTVGDLSTVRLKLVPETLGDISVKLTIQGTTVNAQIMAQTPQAHDAIVAGQQQLTKALADAGLKLDNFTVDLAGGFASFQQQQQQQSSQNGTSYGRAALLGGVDTPETDDAALSAAPNFGPPVLAGQNWSALNYLV